MSTVHLRNGDCVEVMRTLADGSVGAIVSDPPYGLRFMGKEFDDLGDGAAQREWHRGWITDAYRVLKPGGVIKAFGGTRTFHHLGAVMREVGFTDLRLEAWNYGSGFPKSMNIGKQIDKSVGAERRVIMSRTMVQGGGSSLEIRMGARREVSVNITAPATEAAKVWDGWGTALKPSWEPVLVGRKTE